MCGRYYLASEDMNLVITALLRSLEGKGGSKAKLAGEIYPGDTAPVLANNRALQCRAFFMDWGFQFQNRRIINARSETARQKPLFRDSMQSRRCIIPASHYFEWDQTTHARYRFAPENGKSLLLGGLYRQESNGSYSYTILTRDAAPHMRELHPRMPVILPADSVSAWLSPAFDPDRILACAREDIAFSPAPQLSLDKPPPDALY